MAAKEFKKMVLAWLAENGIFPDKVRVYNTRRYGLEVRCYTSPMEYTSSRVSSRRTGEPFEENGRMVIATTRGHHTIRQAMYCHINEDDFVGKNAAEKQFALQVFKDSFTQK